MVVAVSLQVATNYANDYSDGVRGTDADDKRVGPVRLVGQGLASPSAVKRAAMLAFGVAGVAGAALAVAVGPELLVVGAAAIAAGWFYTGGPALRLRGLRRGVRLRVLRRGGHRGVGLRADRVALLARPRCVRARGLLATALLVVNNLRDIPGDTEVGKRTLAVRLGDRRTRVLYTALMIGAYVTVPFVAGAGGRLYAGAALFSVLLARMPVIAVLSGARGADLIGVLGQTGRVQLAFGLLFTVGLAILP
jgi:1,4-dihydroxy-2-naphthoate polyprenyltransferase